MLSIALRSGRRYRPMLDAKSVLAAARGRWVEILKTAGLTDDQLDPKKHQPCPVCGGDDRYRAFDDVAETGGVLCNQCHKSDNKTGDKTLMWFAKMTFPQAIEN